MKNKKEAAEEKFRSMESLVDVQKRTIAQLKEEIFEEKLLRTLESRTIFLKIISNLKVSSSVKKNIKKMAKFIFLTKSSHLEIFQSSNFYCEKRARKAIFKN